MGKATNIVSVAVIILQTIGCLASEGGVRLEDVKVLTLTHGQMTTGRRSSPVPQLRCVGGSARCEFVPNVVQCKNKGSDGESIQWECKTEMENAYRFGNISVACEGYEYPDDPYVLKGSCGLEYTIDFTKEGMEIDKLKQNNFFKNLLFGALIAAVIVYAIYLILGINLVKLFIIKCLDDGGSSSSPPLTISKTTYYFVEGSSDTRSRRSDSSSGTRTASGFGGTTRR